MIRRILIFACAVLLFLSPVSAIETDYSIEFNTGEEKCHVKDAFLYVSSQKIVAETQIISCCVMDNCVDIPFDTKNLMEYEKEDLIENFNICHIRERLKAGDLNPTVFSFGDNFNFCNYFGYDVLKQESINLASLFGTKVASHLPENAANIIGATSSAGKYLGVIKSFSVGMFATSVVCTNVLELEKEAIEKVAICNNYLNNINVGNAYYGITADLEKCNSEASKQLKDIVDNLGMQLKSAVDTVGNFFLAFYNFFQDPTNMKFEVEKSTYQHIKESYEKISKTDPILGDPNATLLAEAALLRLKQKRENSEKKLNELTIYLSATENKRPNTISIFLINIFYQPDYNQTRIGSHITKARNLLSDMESLISVSKYNSADSHTEKIKGTIKEADVSIDIENDTPRGYDLWNIAIIIGLIILIAIIWYLFL